MPLSNISLHAELYEKFGLAPPRGIPVVALRETGKDGDGAALSGEKPLPLIATMGRVIRNGWGFRSEALREVCKKARRAERAFCSSIRLTRLLRDRAGSIHHGCLSKDSEPNASRDRQSARRQGVLYWRLRTAPERIGEKKKKKKNPLCCGVAA